MQTLHPTTQPSHPGRPVRAALRMEAVRKVYGTADTPVVALDGVTVGLPSGSFTAIMGPS